MSHNEKEIDELTFEEALKQLEETVSKLEAGEHSLEESLELFERGQNLTSYCNELLENASLRVERLTADGEIVDIQVSD